MFDIKTLCHILLVLNCLTLIACENPSIVEDKGIEGWLKAEAIPLHTVVPEQGFDDLEPLQNILDGVQIVGLGESTHGTREFFQFKHRMIEYLVVEMGFTVVAIEASYPACLNINEYVLSGQGDRAAALASQGFWTWDTEEVSELIEWMRVYNQRVPKDKKVKFFGFDFQVQGQAKKVVLDFFDLVAPERVARTDSIFHQIPAKLSSKQASKSLGNDTSLLDELHSLVGYLNLNRSRFITLTSQEEFEKVSQHARILAQFVDIKNTRAPYQGPQETTLGKRDAYMAENVQFILNQEKPGTKMVIWAHNTHISTGQTGPGLRMGYHLRKAFGSAYYALGLSFNRGSFQARDISSNLGKPLKEFIVGSAPEASIEWLFTKVGIGDFIIDFRYSSPNEEAKRWLAASNKMRSIGGGFSQRSERWLMPIVLDREFDGLVFIEQTTRAHPTPTGVRLE